MHSEYTATVSVCSLEEQQRAFGTALIEPHQPIPAGVVGRYGQTSFRRFNVYRNNVVAGQVSTLRDAFPAILQLVGEEFFTAMAREYVASHLPKTPMMFDYGEDFADFIGAFEPTQELPYLGDVARVERAWIESYHALDCNAAPPITLSSVLATDLRFVGFQLHPSVRMVKSRYPAFSIWKINTKREEFRTISLNEGAEDVLVVRPDYEVHVHQLAKGGMQFFNALQDGLSIVDAAEKAFESAPDFDLPINMRMLIGDRLITNTFVTRYNRPTLNSFLG